MSTEKTLFRIHKAIAKSFVRSMLQYDLLIDAPLRDGPRILAVNHPTTTDPLLLPLVVDQPVYILVTEMAFEMPVLGKLIEKAGHIPVPREEGRTKADRNPRERGQVIPSALRRLQAGETIAVFPEGAVSPSIGEFGPPHSGAARIALQSGVPVYPVGIHLDPRGCVEETVSTEHFTDTARWARKGAYYLTIGKPMQFAGDAQDRTYVEQVSRRIMDAIEVQARRSESRMATTHISWQPLFGRRTSLVNS